MNLIICLDERNGWCFNNRRQSRDVTVCRQCLRLSENNVLRMNAYSSKLFPDNSSAILVSESFLSDASQGDYCFSEGTLPPLHEVEKVYVFRWNRIYPADVTFSPEEAGFHLTHTEEFSGNSHPLITMEVYEP